MYPPTKSVPERSATGRSSQWPPLAASRSSFRQECTVRSRSRKRCARLPRPAIRTWPYCIASRTTRPHPHDIALGNVQLIRERFGVVAGYSDHTRRIPHPARRGGAWSACRREAHNAGLRRAERAGLEGLVRPRQSGRVRQSSARHRGGDNDTSLTVPPRTKSGASFGPARVSSLGARLPRGK